MSDEWKTGEVTTPYCGPADYGSDTGPNAIGFMTRPRRFQSDGKVIVLMEFPPRQPVKPTTPPESAA